MRMRRKSENLCKKQGIKIVLAIMVMVSIFKNIGINDVFAKENMVEELPNSNTVSLENIIQPDENGQYSCTYKGTETGREYVLLVVSGVYETVDEIDPDRLESDLLYIDQKMADTTELSFSGFTPSRVENSTILISSETMSASIIGYISKDIFKKGSYTLDEKGTVLLSNTMSVVKDTLWQDFKSLLPTSCYLQVCSDYAETVCIPVKMVWRECETYDSTKIGNTFEITADVVLQEGYDAGELTEIVLQVMEPFHMSVTVQDTERIPESIQVIKKQTVYRQGESVSDADIFVKIVYSDGTIRDVFGWITNISEISTAEIGIQYLTVTYVESGVTLQAQVAVSVVAAESNEVLQVAFETLGGSYITPCFVEKGARLESVEDPVKEGFVFFGWYFNGKLWDFESDIVENNMVLTARWLKKYEKEDGIYCYIEEGQEEYEYTGKAIKPAVVVMDRNFRMLQLKKDFVIKYTNNVQVSSDNAKANAIITGKGSYTGTVEIPFIITTKNIANEADVMMKFKSYSAYKKNGCTPVPSGKYNGKALKSKKDFTVSYEKLEKYDDENGIKIKDSFIKDAGYYRVIVDGRGNFTGSREFKFQIGAEGQKDIGKATVKFSSSANIAYTGNKTVLEGVTLKVGKIQLTEGIDYNIYYPEDNVNVGKKTAIARALPGNGVYYGEKEIKYEITGMPMKAVKVGLRNKRTGYTGIPVTDNIANVVIRLDKKKAELLKNYYGDEFREGEDYVLRENIDYTVSYQNNEKAGKAAVILSGKGIFSGSIKKQFAIDRVNINSSNMEITLLNESVPQKKSGAVVAVQAIHTENGRRYILREGTDYTLYFTNNKKVGTDAKVTVKGIGNYTGSLLKSFKINVKSLDTDDINVVVINPVKVDKKASYIYKPEIMLYDDGMLLKKGTDYIVDYSGCVMQEETTNGKKDGFVIIKGKDGGSYNGSCMAAYSVSSDTIGSKKCSIIIEDQLYTGTPIEFEPEDNEDCAKFEANITREDGQSVNLILGKDFEIISYSKNVTCGTAKVLIKGTGDYAGKKAVKFKIVRQRLQ